MKKHLQNRSGFTIIEVVLVLAIAGLIFLIVFLALPQLQRSQRDSARRSDVGRYISAISSYQSNNNGTVPTAAEVNADVLGNYIDDLDNYTDGGEVVAYSGEVDPNTTLSDANVDFTNIFFYAEGQDCENNTNTRTYSLGIYLEGGGFYCQEG